MCVTAWLNYLVKQIIYLTACLYLEETEEQSIATRRGKYVEIHKGCLLQEEQYKLLAL